jgi:hypothetical protein
LISIEHTDMKTRLLARIAALVTVAAAIAMFLWPASAEAADHQLDGWANPDPDINSNDLGSAMTQGPGGRVDGWANRDLDIGAFGSAMTQGVGSLLDGWANRDLDIGAFGSAITQAQSINVSTWGALGTRAGGEVIGSDF